MKKVFIGYLNEIENGLSKHNRQVRLHDLIDDNAEGLMIDICSYSHKAEHKELKKIIGKKIMITLEVLDD